MKTINITNGIPKNQFIQLLQKGEAFILKGKEILVFEKEKIKRFNKERLAQLAAKESLNIGEINSSLQTELENITHIKGIELTKYDKQLLATGQTISVGNNKVKFEDGKLHIEDPKQNLDFHKLKK